ncbi:hypothetical protein EVAR_56824_1 [Eumeta japonica]|uniref:Uncharacterized protein n=1 Tax=Eumeta variegata TaxID=151549 RepID=A0A4C1ZH74_EUMVA|nr:hypothetical protein EVAR_56824_1 [Eumeta japonica]
MRLRPQKKIQTLPHVLEEYDMFLKKGAEAQTAIDARGNDMAIELTERKKQKINSTYNSITINLKLSEKYNMWSLSCRHADLKDGKVNTNAMQGAVNITLHLKEEKLTSERILSTETTEKSERTERAKNEKVTQHMRRDIIILTSSILIATLAAILITILLCYVCKRNNGPKQNDDGATTYADLDFAHESGHTVVSGESSSPYAEILYPDENDEVGYATVPDKRTKDKDAVESPYAEISPYAEMSFKNELSQQISDIYAKVLPKSQRNKKLEDSQTKNDNYATVVPKSKRNKPPTGDDRNDVSKNSRIIFGDDLYAEIPMKNQSGYVTYANVSKECSAYANAREEDANKYPNINIELNGEGETVTYANLREKIRAGNACASAAVVKQAAARNAENVRKNIAHDEVHCDDRKKLIHK